MQTRKSRDLLLSMIVLMAAGTIAGTVSLFGTPQAPCAGTSQGQAEITLWADLNGYNDSKEANGQGPNLTIQRCDIVILNLANRDVQAHGLAVDLYASRGAEAAGGFTVSIRFLAYKTGTFRVFCNTRCSVHDYMQHAQLTVVCASGSGC